MPGLALVAFFTLIVAVHGQVMHGETMMENPNDLNNTVAVHGQVIPGAVMTEDPNDPKYMEKAWKTAKIVNWKSDLKYLMVPIKVVKVDSQVEDGIKHTLEVLLGQSECIKGDVKLAQLPAANCQLIPEGNRTLYKVELLVKPWEDEEKYTISKIKDVAAEETL
ncbi:hypothetical protein ANCCEY_10382 [Ancylostoma ceylanicum]|uniref:Cystatin domain-containing protein n=2 Tax=Ancylostoma ceylanicum TaxID=53326 RepID=A0A0D6LF04_9BILA|nr:hypothetical protein ANCCEY_10382 [Ancylostoma ceylanicum]EYC44922.1 hypothetical protein Y032_0445g1583 [Ancylostoma ceylanicum]